MSSLAGFVPFWMVYGIGCRHPTYQHVTEGDAIAEAERLAREHPGITFVVLSSIEAIRFRGIERVNLRDNIPF